MVTIVSLWLAILISAVLVWIANTLVLMLFHRSDYRALPNEEAAIKALRPQNLEPGQYNIPNVASWDELKKPEVVEKFEHGPVGFLTVLPAGVPAIAKNMLLTLVYYVAISVIVAYLATRTLPSGSDYLTVFRVTGTVAWLAYGTAIIPDAIYYGRPWSAVAQNLFDALIYGLLTAGVFGWLWP